LLQSTTKTEKQKNGYAFDTQFCLRYKLH